MVWCPSVRPSGPRYVLKLLENMPSNFLHHLVAAPFYFFHKKRYSEIVTSIGGGVWKYLRNGTR